MNDIGLKVDILHAEFSKLTEPDVGVARIVAGVLLAALNDRTKLGAAFASV